MSKDINEKEFVTETVESIQEQQQIQVIKRRKENEYNSEKERMLVEQIDKSFNIDEAEKDLNNRPAYQYVDKITGNIVFPASTRKVILRDTNGEEMLVDNHEQIQKIKRANGKILNPENNSTADLSNTAGYDPSIEDDLDFE